MARKYSHGVSFEEAVRRWRLDTEDKIERCVKISTATVVEAANANAPRRTGRLRRSVRTSVGGAAPSPGLRKALEGYELGQPIIVTWTRFYAKIQERGARGRRGRRIGGKRFVARAVRQWRAIVNHVAERISKE